MAEDEHSQAADASDRRSGDSSSGSGNGGAADANGQVLARLEQLERAFGEQSARLRAIEQRFGFVDYTTKTRPFAQGAANASSAPQTGEAQGGTEARENFHANENRDAAGNRDAAPHADAAPFASTPRAGANWQQANASNAQMAETPESSGILPARRDLEQLIGGSLFNWLGIIAVTLTVGFFLKYAFENEWIGPRGRVLLGGAAGCGILAFAERLRARGYKSYAYVLSGGGILILYLTVYAARVFYDLVGVLPAFLLMIAVTTTAVLLAARYHAYAIAVLGLIGGFMTPVMLSTGVDNQLGLFSYIALLNSGVLALAYFKRWRSLNHMAFVATVLMFAGWWLAWYDRTKLWPTLFFLTLFFLMFNALGVVYNVIKQRPARWFDISLIISNATLFFAASYALLERDHHPILGGYALLWSGFYVLLFYFTYQRHRADKLLTFSYVGAAVTFFTIAVAIQFDQHWVTIAWAMEGLMLTWIGLRADTDAPRYAALPVFAFAIMHWVASDMVDFAYHANEAFVPLLNRRAVSAAALVAALGGAFWLYRREGERVDHDEREIVSAVLVLAANVMALTLLSLDANDYFNARLALVDNREGYYDVYRSIENARQFTLTLLWAFYALAVLIVGAKRNLPVLRYGALAWLCVTGAKLLTADARFYNAAWHLPLFNQTFAAFVAYVAALWYAARLYVHANEIDERERRIVLTAITVAANLYAIIALSLEATGYFDKRFQAITLNNFDPETPNISYADPRLRDLRLAQGLSLSLIWTLYGGAMLLYGHTRKNRLLRIMALVLLTATAFKVFFLDLAALEKFYRIVSFLVLGAILLAVSFLYQQKQRGAAKADGG
ncbi:MAG TPA: DUF2339 domain-containing protein [Pyrinomonadaceae bacterium]|jgi:uncharacterized membrane protein|nr:DUF2339 domain-containing protein [Pyrinomonadaceae bacterium]